MADKVICASLLSHRRFKRLIPKRRRGLLRSGAVLLNPGEDVGWHSTAESEEAIVVLRGKGMLYYDGKSKKIKAGLFIYIPSGVVHNIRNDSRQQLVYVYICK